MSDLCVAADDRLGFLNCAKVSGHTDSGFFCLDCDEMNKKISLMAMGLLLALSSWGAAQAILQGSEIEDSGYYNVGQFDHQFQASAVTTPTPAIFAGVSSKTTLTYRFHYPNGHNVVSNAPQMTLPGQHPLVVFMHGWGGSPADYNVLLSHLASWGFVVASVFYDRAPVTSELPIEEAYESWLLMQYLTDVAGVPNSGHPISYLVDPSPTAPVTVAGHSMGGAACFYLAGAEPRVKTIAALEPYDETQIQPFGICDPTSLYAGTNQANVLAENFDGALYMLEGGDDNLVGTSVQLWFDRVNQGSVKPRRNMKLKIQGSGHFGGTDLAVIPGLNLPCGLTLTDDMDLPDQHRFHRRFLAGCLLGELVGGEAENFFGHLFGVEMENETAFSLGTNAVVPVQTNVQSNSEDAVLWSIQTSLTSDPLCMNVVNPPFPGSVSVGVAGRPGDEDLTLLMVPKSNLPPGGYGAQEYLVWYLFEITNNVGSPMNSFDATGIKECNLPILATGFHVDFISYLWRYSSYDLTRIGGLVIQ